MLDPLFEEPPVVVPSGTLRSFTQLYMNYFYLIHYFFKYINKSVCILQYFEVNNHQETAHLPVNCLIPFSKRCTLVQRPEICSSKSECTFLRAKLVPDPTLCRKTDRATSWYCFRRGLRMCAMKPGSNQGRSAR